MTQSLSYYINLIETRNHKQKLHEIEYNWRTKENGTLWFNTKTSMFVETGEGLLGQSWPIKHHSQDVKYHPEKYGLTSDDIKNIDRKITGSKKSKTARFDADLIQMMFENGWVRINRNPDMGTIHGRNKREVQLACRAYLDRWGFGREILLHITPKLLEQSTEVHFYDYDTAALFADKGIINPRNIIQRH